MDTPAYFVAEGALNRAEKVLEQAEKRGESPDAGSLGKMLQQVKEAFDKAGATAAAVCGFVEKAKTLGPLLGKSAVWLAGLL